MDREEVTPTPAVSQQDGCPPIDAAIDLQGAVHPSHDRRRSDGRRLVQKGSLKESDLIEAKLQAKATKTKEDITEEERKKERRAANRLSAFQSRLRRKVIIKDLQKTVASLSKDNAEQQKQNLELQQELLAARQENASLRAQLSSRSSKNSSETAHSSQQSATQGIVNLLGPQEMTNPILHQLIADSHRNGKMPAEAVALIAELVAIKQRKDAILKEVQEKKKKQQVAAPSPAVLAELRKILGTQSHDGAREMLLKVLQQLQGARSM